LEQSLVCAHITLGILIVRVMLEADAVRVELHGVAVANGWLGHGLVDVDDDELMSVQRTLRTRDANLNFSEIKLVSQFGYLRVYITKCYKGK